MLRPIDSSSCLLRSVSLADATSLFWRKLVAVMLFVTLFDVRPVKGCVGLFYCPAVLLWATGGKAGEANPPKVPEGAAAVFCR